ncbi:MAG: phasin family protein [Pseudorhodoplanes sp.]|uniref:phasin family protein n=1 Tax=Pseudorhodoplanes sp. TaxID=1934341 RepID=UPI003D0DF0D6
MDETGTKWTLPAFNAAEFTKLGKEQTDALIEMQRELAKLIEQANADWLARMETEREFASDLAGKLSSARTLPDAAKAYQEWMARRIETMTKDSQKFFADGQKFVASMNRLMSPGRGSGT